MRQNPDIFDMYPDDAGRLSPKFTFYDPCVIMFKIVLFTLCNKEVSMKTKCFLGVIFILGLTVALCNTGYGQSARCVILDKQDNTALVSCNGGAAQSINLGGKADLYKVGDSIDNTTTPASRIRSTGVPGDPRSSSDKTSPPRAR
jgi:hypothetical protein